MKINSGRAPISSRNLNRQFRLQSISEKKSDEPEFSQRGDTGWKSKKIRTCWKSKSTSTNPPAQRTSYLMHFMGPCHTCSLRERSFSPDKFTRHRFTSWNLHRNSFPNAIVLNGCQKAIFPFHIYWYLIPSNYFLEYVMYNSVVHGYFDELVPNTITHTPT